MASIVFLSMIFLLSIFRAIIPNLKFLEYAYCELWPVGKNYPSPPRPVLEGLKKAWS